MGSIVSGKYYISFTGHDSYLEEKEKDFVLHALFGLCSYGRVFILADQYSSGPLWIPLHSGISFFDSRNLVYALSGER